MHVSFFKQAIFQKGTDKTFIYTYQSLYDSSYIHCCADWMSDVHKILTK